MGSALPPMTNPMSSAWADAGFIVADSPMTPAPAVATSPNPIQRSLRPDILRPPQRWKSALSGYQSSLPQAAAIPHMFYAYYASLSKKYTGFRWRKLSLLPRPSLSHWALELHEASAAPSI